MACVTKYHPYSFILMLAIFFSFLGLIIVGRKSNIKAVLEKAKQYLNDSYKVDGGVIPSISGLSLYASCPRSSLYNYAQQSDEFSGILEMIKARQEIELINKGLTGEFNSSIAKLMLANHGYSDKQQFGHQSSDGSFIDKLTKIELVFTS